MSSSTSNLVAAAVSTGDQRLEAQRVNNTASCWDKYGECGDVAKLWKKMYFCKIRINYDWFSLFSFIGEN